MPLNLDTPAAIAATVDAVEVDSFSVDLDRNELIIGYSDLAAGVAVRQSVLVLSGLDFAGSINRANELANAMPPGQVNVYGAIKVALYEALTTHTDRTGTVA